MEISEQYKSSQHAVISPDNAHVASLHGSHLHLRSTVTLEIERSIPVQQDHPVKIHSIRWSPISASNGASNRILVSDDENTRAWDLRDQKWNALINNGSGGMGKIVHGDFGRTENEVVLFSDFSSKVTIWNLNTGRSVEIKDPKLSSPAKVAAGYSYRPRSGLFTLLSRPAAQDVLTMHAPNTYFVLKTISLASSDAQGFKWSPDGKWIAVWDTPSVGYRVYIYTADGNLFRMYSGEYEGDVEGLGVRSIEWGPKGEYLAIGGHDRRVTLLSTRTFSPLVFLDHTGIIHLTSGSVFQESVSATGSRTYSVAPQPISPPTALPTQNPAGEVSIKKGISIATFNADGTLFASRDDSCPTTIWIWDLARLAPRTIIIQHSPIRSLIFHPTLPNLMLIQCMHDEPVLYLWDASEDVPAAIKPTLPKINNKPLASWLPTAADRKPSVLFGDTQNHVIIWPHGRDPILRFEHSDASDKEGDSEDSLFDILSGRKPAPVLHSTQTLDDGFDFDESTCLEDTFRSRRQQQSTAELDDPLDESCFF